LPGNARAAAAVAVLDNSGAGAVEKLQQLVGRELDVLVTPLGSSVVTRDQAGAMDAAEIAINERVSGLGLVRRTLGQPEMPLGIFVPRM
jgi:hypothetical protein